MVMISESTRSLQWCLVGAGLQLLAAEMVFAFVGYRGRMTIRGSFC